MISINTISLGISTASLLAVLTSYLVIRRKLEQKSEQVDQIEQKIEEIQLVENKVFGDSSDPEKFEENISQLAERLFELIKSKYQLEDVTTYQEMIDKLKSMDEGDEETREDLINLFQYFVELEYSEEELSQEEKAIVRQAAFSLIRRAGPNLVDR